MLGDRTSTRSWHCKTRLTRQAAQKFCRHNFSRPTLPQLSGSGGRSRDPELSVEFYKAFLLACPKKKKKLKSSRQPARGGARGGKRPSAQKTVRAARPGFLNNQKKKQKKVEKTLESTDLTPKKKHQGASHFLCPDPTARARPPPPCPARATSNNPDRARAARLTGDSLFPSSSSAGYLRKDEHPD